MYLTIKKKKLYYIILKATNKIKALLDAVEACKIIPHLILLKYVAPSSTEGGSNAHGKLVPFAIRRKRRITSIGVVVFLWAFMLMLAVLLYVFVFCFGI